MEIFPKLFNRVVWNLFNDLTGMNTLSKFSDALYAANVIFDNDEKNIPHTLLILFK